MTDNIRDLMEGWSRYRRNRRNDIIKIVIVWVLVFGVVVGREVLRSL